MEAVRVLLENYWIQKDKNKELYWKTKREEENYKKFFTDQVGWSLIQNEKILKLEKIPSHAESFMGITEFTEIMDYGIFCGVLLFLEDKEEKEQFLLSELTAMIEAQLQDYMELNWTLFLHRKSLVRVLQFAENMGFLEVYDGISKQVAEGIDHEVLYENTGLSRYFATNFGYSIDNFTSYEDFERKQIQELETERGHFRIHRIYRQLISSPAVYWDSSENPDAVYLKNQRWRVQSYLKEKMGGDLHIHKNAAFFVLDENDCFGEFHPRDKTISEIVLNFSMEIRKKIENQELKREKNDWVLISDTEFTTIFISCKEKYSVAWSKEFREMPLEKGMEILLGYMESWMLLKRQGEKICLFPSVGKITGIYPEDFLKKEGKKHG